MKYKVDAAVVVGAGTMGAAIAAHLANAGIPVTLLDIVPEQLTSDEQAAGLTLNDRPVRDRIVTRGLERVRASKPASFFSSDQDALVRTGNLEDGFDAVARADWILEAVVEDLKVKQTLMARIDSVRKPEAIVSTNTSGISVSRIAEGRSQGFKKHFLGTHFFNPPRYLKLLELIPIAETLNAVSEFMAWFGEYRLGKGVVVCKDTPNFIANRVAYATGAFGLDYILKNGYTIEEVDAVTGPLIGRPKTATFRLLDLVGLDLWAHVGENLAQAIPHDALAMPYITSEEPNALIKAMLDHGWLGNKTGTGFYKEVKTDSGREYWPLDLHKLEHFPPSKPRFESVGKAKDIPDLGERLKVMLAGSDRAAELTRVLTYQALQYASAVIPEIADSPKPIDDAIRWGFGHAAGPFEIWDLLGIVETVKKMKAAGFPPADWVASMLKAGHAGFYQYTGGDKVGVYDVCKKKYIPIRRASDLIVLNRLKQAEKIIDRNSGASLYDLGDDVALVEFHTKLNTLDEDIFAILSSALDRVEKDFAGLVIGNEAENFSAGANLGLVLMGAKSGQWEMLEVVVRRFQNLNMRMRYFPRPVVAAPAGMALGGGCEITMSAGRVVAAAELYTGLVELGAGVIPAGGGTKEMLRRVVNPPMRTENANVLPYLQRLLEQVGQAKVSTSAEHARQMSILTTADRVVLNREHVLMEAKREVLHMVESGYNAPSPEPIYAAGRDVLGAMRVGLFMFQEGRFISPYDRHIAAQLANVLTGGDLSRPAWVSEQYILDLEREAFLSLCGEEKSQERMYSILQTGKPLRN